MSFDVHNTIKFEGLNSEIAPELIKDGEARDILNFRMEKVGKLVSRNGYTYGLFGKISPTGENKSLTDYKINGGIIGLGELILENKWDAVDSDRLMVYLIRGYESDKPIGESDRRNREEYLFSPLTGNYKNWLFNPGNLFLSGDPLLDSDLGNMRDAYPMGSNENLVPLFAPNKELPDYEWQPVNQDKPYDHWIKQYVDINQYRNKLVISDRINGDLLLEDEYERKDIDAWSSGDHLLHMRENCLASFDKDIVELDPRFKTGEENDVAEGVENGFGLYNYVLPKIITKKTEDQAIPRLTDPDFLGDDLTPSAEMNQKLRAYLETRNSDEPLLSIGCSVGQGDYTNSIPKNDVIQSAIKANTKNAPITPSYFRFTNMKDELEYPNVLGEVKLNEEEYIDNTLRQDEQSNQDGRLTKDISADVYVWEDYRVKYFPTYGRIYNDSIDGVDYQSIYYPYYMRDIDRLFTKTVPGAPKIIKLKTKEGAGKYAPLGVWRYKFVWDFGGGVYSAPSEPIVVPDIMWSSIKDTNLQTDILDPTTYQGRFYQHEGIKENEYDSGSNIIVPTDSEFGINAIPQAVSDVYNGVPSMQTLKLYQPGLGTISFTDFGDAFYELKKKIYGKINNRYGIGNEYTKTEILADLIKAGNLACAITGFFGEDDVILNGLAWEFACANVNPYDWADDEISGKFGIPRPLNNEAKRGEITIPVFKNELNKRSWLSVFDEEGRYRLSHLLEAELGTSPYKPRKFFTSPYHLYLFPSWALERFFYVPTGNAGRMYLNFVSDLDHLNVSELYNGITYDEYKYRPHTLLRAVNDVYSSDRLKITNPKVPQEVRNRLIKEGIIELKLLDKDEEVPLKMYDWGPKTPGPLNPDFIKVGNHAPIDYYDSTLYHEDVDGNTPTELLRDKMVTCPVKQYGSVHQIYYDEIIFKNIDIYLYGEGERFLGYEQLSSYFPSSLLFKAPRIAIKIPQANVPKKAKRLLIYRTKASHANDYSPTDYGLVERVEIKRDSGHNAIHEFEDGSTYAGAYYFDEIGDDQLDFANNPMEHDGLRRAIRSRFNASLNERVYFYNFEEGYRPESPRKDDEILLYPDKYDPLTNGKVPNVAITTMEVEPTESGFTTDKHFIYGWVYADMNGALSELVETNTVDVLAATNSVTMQVVLSFLPDIYDDSIKELQIYRKDVDASEPKFYKIGKLEEGDEGIFVDSNLKNGAELGNTDIVWETYEGGVRWSEPYRPDWIKADSFAEVKAGDGKQGTGLETLYGNLILFKETSIHRYAVQGTVPPISRVDEISPDLGCIAPNAHININNNLYFLSWKGIMSYNNNVAKNIDEKFNEELQFLLSVKDKSAIRDITMGFNSAYNELYMNVPKLATGGRESDYGKHDMYGYERTLLGHIYVIALFAGYSTKFGYQTTILNAETGNWLKEAFDPLQHIRLYYNNSLGEMRSADIVPSRYGRTGTDDGVMWSGIYVETPYLTNIYNDPDVIPYYILYDNSGGSWTSSRVAIEHLDEDVVYDREGELALQTTDPFYAIFPYTKFAPYNSIFKSKFFTGADETLIKRIRRILVNVFSKGNIDLAGIVIPHDTMDERIENIWWALPIASQNVFNYASTVDFFNPVTLQQYTGTNRNILSFIPLILTESHTAHDRYPDTLGKPVRFSIEINAKKRTQINEMTTWWRGIHKYLS